MMASSIWPTEYYDSWPVKYYDSGKIWANLAEIVMQLDTSRIVNPVIRVDHRGLFFTIAFSLWPVEYYDGGKIWGNLA